MGRRLCARKRHGFVCVRENMGPRNLISVRNLSPQTKIQGSHHIDKLKSDILCYFKSKLGFGFARIFLP